MFFSDPPLLVFRRDKNIRESLVRSRIQTNFTPGTFPCNHPRCLSCRHLSTTTVLKTPLSSISINDSFTCSSRNVIYALLCIRCNKVYIGETGRTLGTRFREHRRDVLNHAPKPVPTHFLSEGHHGISDMSILGIKSLNCGSRERFSLEQRLISEHGTLHPRGINAQHCYT